MHGCEWRVHPSTIAENLELVITPRQAVPTNSELFAGADHGNCHIKFRDNQANFLTEGIGYIDVAQGVADCGTWIRKSVGCRLWLIAGSA